MYEGIRDIRKAVLSGRVRYSPVKLQKLMCSRQHNLQCLHVDFLPLCFLIKYCTNAIILHVDILLILTCKFNNFVWPIPIFVLWFITSTAVFICNHVDVILMVSKSQLNPRFVLRHR